MVIENPIRFGLKTFLVGAAVGLTIGIGLMASGICPPLLVIPAVLIFVLANSPLFAWAGTYATIAVISSVSALMLVATAAVLETMDRVCTALWDFCKGLKRCCTDNSENEDLSESSIRGSSTGKMIAGPLKTSSDHKKQGPQDEETKLDNSSSNTTVPKEVNRGRRGSYSDQYVKGSSMSV